jgi:transcriptional regulator with XRE-family HTH domain
MTRRRPKESVELVEGVGRRIRLARERQGWTQEMAAQRIGMSVEGYARVERGLVSPSLETFTRICVDMAVSADELLCLTRKTRGDGASAPNQGQETSELLLRIVARLAELDDESLRLIDHAVLFAWRHKQSAKGDPSG